MGDMISSFVHSYLQLRPFIRSLTSVTLICYTHSHSHKHHPFLPPTLPSTHCIFISFTVPRPHSPSSPPPGQRHFLGSPRSHPGPYPPPGDQSPLTQILFPGIHALRVALKVPLRVAFVHTDSRRRVFFGGRVPGHVSSHRSARFAVGGRRGGGETWADVGGRSKCSGGL